MDKTFKLQQYKEEGYSGCALTALVMIGYLVLGVFFLSKWGAGGIFFLMGLAIVAFYFIQNRTRSACIVTTNEEGFTIEVTHKSAQIEVGTRLFLWKDLTEYKHYYGKGSRHLVLSFRGNEEISFSGYAVNDLKKYLVERFPERDYETTKKKRS